MEQRGFCGRRRFPDSALFHPGQHAAAFAERGWHGHRLIRAPAAELARVLDGQAEAQRLIDAVDQLLDSPPPATDPAELDAPRAACRRLADAWSAQPWLADLLETWPGPIAHEAQALGERLADGNQGAALAQLRDLAEVLIKLPAVILARDLLSHQPPPALAARIHQTLYGKHPAMGDWLALLDTHLVPAVRGWPEDAEPLTAPTLADLFQRPNGKRTKLTNALWAQVALRNAEGHGAWRRDEAEVVTLLRHHLLGDLGADDWRRAGMNPPAESIVPLAEGLAFAVAADPWRGLGLAIATAAETRPLRGWRSIREHHDQARAHADAERPASIQLQPATGAPLDLGPYLAGRHCAICGYQDAFFFNGADRDGARFDLLDYLQGHRQRLTWHQVRDLHADRRRLAPALDPALNLAPPVDANGPDGQQTLLQASVQRLLDGLAFERRYLSPDYLRAPLADLLRRRDRGLFWLQAPAHCGKSHLVRGLAEAGAIGEPALVDDLRVAAVYIRKEYRFGPSALLPLLERGLAAALDLAERNDLRLPQFDEHANHPSAELAAKLAAFRALADHSGPLLICLDGLDELRPPAADERSLLDFLPTPDRLPPATYLLLTSRLRHDPDDRADAARAAHGCPPWVWSRTAHLRPDPDRGLICHAIDRNDPDYQALMRAWTRRELAPARKALLARRRAAGEGQAAAEAAAQAAVDADLDQLFTDLLAKAERRFLQLAFLVDRIIERDLLLDRARIDALPAPADLFSDYLERLPETLGPKQAELARLILLTLAAAEQAHGWLVNASPDPLPVDADWRGLPLDALADLSHQPDPIRGPDADLILLLYRLRAALGTWRGEAAPAARYRLGVKGLLDAIAAHPTLGPRLAETHQRLAAETLDLIEPPAAGDAPAPTPATPTRLRYALAHARLSGDAGLAERISGSTRLFWAINDQATTAYHDLRLSEAHQWWTLAILQAEAMQAADDPIWRNHLATAYSNRGLAKQDAGGHGPAAAVADYGAAIEIREGMRDDLLAARGELGWSQIQRYELGQGVARGMHACRAAARPDLADAAVVAIRLDTARCPARAVRSELAR